MKKDIKKNKIDLEMQEINKIALEFAKDFSDLYETSNFGSMYFGFIHGVKWQRENKKKG